MTDRLAADPGPELDLGSAACAYDLPAGDVDAVLRRAHRRTSRRHRFLAVVSVVALVTTAAVSVDLLDGEAGRTTVSSGTALVRGEVGVTWRAVTPAAGLGFATDIGSGLPLYALSTAPGQADVNAPNTPRVVWRSDDGVEWTSVSNLDGDLFASDLSARDERVYAVGTGPATAAVGAGNQRVSPLLVGWSDDGARTWQRARLPVDLEAIAARSVRSTVRSTAVAAGPTGTLVVGVLDATLDVRASLPAGVTAPDGWASSPTGVDLVGPDIGAGCPEGKYEPGEGEPEFVDPTGEVHPTWCTEDAATRSGMVVSPQDARGVTASYTWEQLGVDGDLLRAVRRQPVAFFAPSGSDRFDRVELPAVSDLQGQLILDASDAGFQLVASTADRVGTASVVLLTSADGRSWSAADGVGDGYAAAAGRTGGVTTIVAQRQGGPVVLRADGAGGWTTLPLTGVLDAGPHAETHLQAAAVGPFGIVAAVVVAPDGFPGGLAEERIVVSRDGATWDVLDAAELAGRPVRGIIRAAVAGDRALVTLSTTANDGSRPEQLVLVGTPT